MPNGAPGRIPGAQRAPSQVPGYPRPQPETAALCQVAEPQPNVNTIRSLCNDLLILQPFTCHTGVAMTFQDTENVQLPCDFTSLYFSHKGSNNLLLDSRFTYHTGAAITLWFYRPLLVLSHRSLLVLHLSHRRWGLFSLFWKLSPW